MPPPKTLIITMSITIKLDEDMRNDLEIEQLSTYLYYIDITLLSFHTSIIILLFY